MLRSNPPFGRRCAQGLVLAGLCALLASPSIEASAADEPAERPKADVLFDGKSLDGWKKTDFSGAGRIEIKDGSIVLNSGRPMTGITSTRSALLRKDYELSYEAKRLSGVDFFAAATFPVGNSYLTFVNGGWGGNITGVSSLDGADASENETGRFVEFRNDRWYKLRVRVTGKMVRCWVDDQQVVAVDHSGHQVGTRIETRANQPLGFATWESTGALRKVEMRKLTPAEIAATDKAEP